jgi:hypothetical protein
MSSLANRLVRRAGIARGKLGSDKVVQHEQLVIVATREHTRRNINDAHCAAFSARHLDNVRAQPEGRLHGRRIQLAKRLGRTTRDAPRAQPASLAHHPAQASTRTTARPSRLLRRTHAQARGHLCSGSQTCRRCRQPCNDVATLRARAAHTPVGAQTLHNKNPIAYRAHTHRAPRRAPGKWRARALPPRGMTALSPVRGDVWARPRLVPRDQRGTCVRRRPTPSPARTRRLEVLAHTAAVHVSSSGSIQQRSRSELKQRHSVLPSQTSVTAAQLQLA